MDKPAHFFQAAFSVDNIIFGFDEDGLKVLLIKRGMQPYEGQWALPGDLTYPHEHIDDAAARILLELTGLQDVYLEQVKAFGAPDRHPLGRVITLAYYSLVRINRYRLTPASFAQQAEWHTVAAARELPLAFDHLEILDTCFERLRQRVRTRPVGFELLAQKFTLTELQHLYEAILGKPLEKRNFRKKILSTGLLIDLNETQAGVAHRPAKLYSFDWEKYKELEQGGYYFEVKETKRQRSGSAVG